MWYRVEGNNVVNGNEEVSHVAASPELARVEAGRLNDAANVYRDPLACEPANPPR